MILYYELYTFILYTVNNIQCSQLRFSIWISPQETRHVSHQYFSVSNLYYFAAEQSSWLNEKQLDSFMKLPRAVSRALHYSPHCQQWLAPSNPLLLLELIKVKPNFLLNPFYTSIVATDFIVIVPVSELKWHTDGLVKLVGYNRRCYLQVVHW